MFTIYDIAYALAHTCRFIGHCGQFYSVAQHSVLCSQLVPDGFKLDALLHDAHEAFIGDMVAPLKRQLKDYRFLEARVQDFVRARLGVASRTPACVKRADLEMLAAEKQQLLPHVQENWDVLHGIQPGHVHITLMPPMQALDLFMTTYNQLGGFDAKTSNQQNSA